MTIASDRPIGVGIIGVNPDRGWGVSAHVPALAALPEFRLAAISTSRAESAAAAGRVLGVPAFDNPQALAAHPDVDLVVVAVKVPTHLALVQAAIDAGKHVLCEWPLGRDAAEGEAMARAAEEAGVQHFTGLQARSAPPVRHARDLVASGYVGRVLSARLMADGPPWGAEVDSPNAYTNDAATGATMRNIPMGHTLDAFCWVLGEFAECHAVAAVQRADIAVIDTCGTVRRTAADQIALAGRLENGAIASVHYRGGSGRAGLPGLVWEIEGTEGHLRLTADNGHLQIMPATIDGGRDGDAMAPIAVPDHLIAAPAVPVGQPYNVGQAYAGIADRLRGRDTAAGRGIPDFRDAVRRHVMLDRIAGGVPL